MSDDPYYSDDDLTRMLTHVADETANRQCPFCSTNSWVYENAGPDRTVVPKVAYIPMYGPQGLLSTSRPTIPVITLTCENCGFVRQHNIPMIQTSLGKKS